MCELYNKAHLSRWRPIDEVVMLILSLWVNWTASLHIDVDIKTRVKSLVYRKHQEGDDKFSCKAGITPE